MYVYVLNSLCNVEKYYVGVTSNLKNRIEAHNNGDCEHTRKFLPRRLEVAVWFRDSNKAFSFEKYLKSGSGRAFSKKHF